MTEQEWINLGKRAVACEGWRWMPGMLAINNDYISSPWRLTVSTCPHESHQTFDACNVNDAPYIRDPATIGCLLALVREAWGAFDVEVWVSRKSATTGIFRMVDENGKRIGFGVGIGDFPIPTGADHVMALGLVAALEAAPTKDKKDA